MALFEYYIALLLVVCAIVAGKLDGIDDYEIIIPKQYGREFGSISTMTNNGHLDEVSFEFLAFKTYYTVHLFKNKLLIPPGYEVMQQSSNGTWIHRRGFKNCYYQGFLVDHPKSKVVANTCNGFSCFIRNENGEEYAIEPLSSEYGEKEPPYSDQHIFYRIDKRRKKHDNKCGVRNSHNQSNGPDYFANKLFTNTSRSNSQEEKHGQASTKYISSIVILDSSYYKKYGTNTENKVLSVMNNADAIYKTMNTRVAVQGLIIWKEKDLINITTDSGISLTNLERYTHDIVFGKLDLNGDSVVLITPTIFKDSVVGLAGVGTMCSSRSCAIIEAHSEEDALVADTVAHEVGHTLGFQHNLKSCKCAKTPCVMGAYLPSSLAKSFSDCAQKEYHKRLEEGRLTCLFDYPDKLYGKPKCGNGFLEKGEDCDCGSEEECRATGADKCCIAKTCKLQYSATCASGKCCENCQYKTSGTLCRKAYDKNCDLPEYCTGTSENCPRNTYVIDGFSCRNGNGTCFHGSCKSLEDQCLALWGPNAIPGGELCFNLNTRPNNMYSHCGKSDTGYIACAKKDIFCGKLQCKPRNQKVSLPRYPIIGKEAGGRSIKIVVFGDGTRCHTAYVPFGKDMEDPTMALSGTKCGNDKMCIDKTCRNISEINQYGISPKDICLNGGILNNRGNCHCPSGYACPNCLHFGLGGSKDSGQGCFVESGQSIMKITVGGGVGALALLATILLAVWKRDSIRGYREVIRIRWMVMRSKKNDKAFSDIRRPIEVDDDVRKESASEQPTYENLQTAIHPAEDCYESLHPGDNIDSMPQVVFNNEKGTSTKESQQSPVFERNSDLKDEIGKVALMPGQKPASPYMANKTRNIGEKTPSPKPVFKIQLQNILHHNQLKYLSYHQ